MKYFLNLVLFYVLIALNVSAKDVITLRSGLEMSVEVIQVGNDQIVYKNSKKKNEPEQFLNIQDVYMIFYEKRGLVYITREGKRVSEDVESLKNLGRKSPALVYLLKGKVYPAYDLLISEDRIEFVRVKKNGTFKKDTTFKMIFNKDEVFLIKYSDGTRDIITEFTSAESQKQETQKSEIKQEDSQESQPHEEDVQQVIFHSVKSGDTLAKLAKRYNVTVEEIKEWNELPAKLKPTARLQTDMQLMLYVDVVTTEK